ncbi:MAG: hypothetical protein HY064_13675 [Bacteroidetes bacterium]|nr:hypothetical protein [Bacteroidota bacterium]
MKKVITLFSCLAVSFAFAQTKTTSTTTTTTTASSTGALSEKAKQLCKTWTLSKTENFGDQHDPTAEQKGDKLSIMDNGQYQFVYNGTSESGTWTLDKSNVWLTLTSSTGTVKKLKILEQTETSLKVDYRDEIDIHNFLYYSAGSSSKKQ